MDELDFKMANISLWGSLKQNMYITNNALVIMSDMMTSLKGDKEYSRKVELL